MVKVGYNVTYNVDDMKAMNEKFKLAFHALEELCENGASKLGIYNDRLYVSWSWWIIQSVHRYYYGENRTKVSEFINKMFTDYFIFYDMIISCIKHEPNTENCVEAEKLKEENLVLIEKWNKGLVLLKGLYSSDLVVSKIYEDICSKLSFLK
jgi:hypothetical protein